MKYFFDESHSPDLLDVPLKGEYLAEVSRLLHEKCETITANATDVLGKNIQTGSIRAIYSALADYFEKPSIQQYGITLREAETLIQQVIANPRDTIESHLEEHIEKRLLSTPEEWKVRRQDMAEENISLSFRNIFSACLAVQEHREEDFRKMGEEYFRKAYAFTIDFLRLLPDISEEFKLKIAMKAVKAAGLNYANYETQYTRHSPIAQLTRTAIEQSQGFVHNVIADIFGIDPDTKAGQLELRKKLQQIEKLLNNKPSLGLN